MPISLRARIIIDHCLAWIWGVPRAHLAPWLQHEYRTWAPGGTQGVRAVTRVAPLCWAGRAKLPVTMAGLVPQVSEHLRRLGYQVTVVIRRESGSTLRPNVHFEEEATGPRRAFLRAIRRHARGQVVVHTDHVIIDRIVHICRYFRDARVLIATERHEDARRLYWGLGYDLLWRLNLVLRGGRWFYRHPRVVCSYGALESCLPGEWDIVIVPYGNEVAHSRVRAALAQMVVSRMYVLVPPAGGRPDRITELMREMLVGPVIHHAHGPEGGPAGVRVLVAETRLRPQGYPPAGLARKREAIWGNGARNQLLGDLSRALADGDTAVLHRHGLLLDDADGLPPARGPRRTVVLVEGTEHGRQLAPFLPSWKLLHLGNHSPGSAVGEAGDKAIPERCILTSSLAARLPDLDVDVLVRADGGDGPLELSWFPPLAGCRRREVVLLDLADDDDRHADRATRRRVADYQSRGWRVDGPRRLIGMD
jgi:hypothetical protein